MVSPDNQSRQDLNDVERSARMYVPLIHLALGADAVGDRERAIAHARRSLDEREPPFLLLARHDSNYRSLRADSRFAALVRELDDSPSHRV